jgi:acyl-CoA thioesterase
MAEALFDRDGERYVATELSLGPWAPDALHGGPVAALLATAIADMPEGEGMQVVRITLELLRPVPRAPLDLTARLLRPGKKVQLREASLSQGGKDVARATGLLIRIGDVPLPADRPEPPETMEPPEQGTPTARLSSLRDFHGFHSVATEHRWVRGQSTPRGPSADWIRLKVPVLAGEAPSPLARACAAADFGNGISSVLTNDFTYINPDLTVYLHRYPRGEWVCLDSVSRVESTGIGLAESGLFDRDGRIGRAVQSLIVDGPVR